ncbi:DUF4145 domain-containing protein [Demequina salsinemoris]|uniref:DUF4145 domain-containing protein n=1 Tax=Demequina salsinemoris TaxID=577470 RepID=UPI001364A39D|nr:DUF4145 domain-containing protein [Demequina salsinemoris]
MSPVPEPDEGLPTNNTPGQGKSAFDCPRCGAFAHQTWQSLQVRLSGGLGDYDDSRLVSGCWSASRCAQCKEWSTWREERLVYPAAGIVSVPHPQMPGEAKDLYEEAREVLGISRRAGTALARASLERLLRTLDADAPGNANLEMRIERISDKIPEPLAQMLTVIRVAGNSSLHVKDMPDDLMVFVLDPDETEVVDMIFESINELVEELIAKPTKVANLYAKVPESIRSRIEQDKNK